MQFVYILKPARTATLSHHLSEQDDAVVTEHLRYLDELNHRGMVTLAGHTTAEDAASFELCVFEAPSESVARDIMNKDPAVWQGIMNAELFPFRVTMTPESAFQS